VALDPLDKLAILVLLEAQCSKRDPLVNLDVVTNYAGFANYYTRSVVNKEHLPDLSAGVDVNTRL